MSPGDCPIGGVLIRRWTHELNDGTIEHRRAVLQRVSQNGLKSLGSDIDLPDEADAIERPLGSYISGATHELVPADKLDAFFVLQAHGLYAQALRLIGVEPRGVNLTDPNRQVT